MKTLHYCYELRSFIKRKGEISQVWIKVFGTFRIQKCSCFREYIKYCVPPLFQSPFNLTQGRAAAVYLELIHAILIIWKLLHVRKPSFQNDDHNYG